jgi:hypothetical protein
VACPSCRQNNDRRKETSFTYDLNGNNTKIIGAPLGSAVAITMGYDKENRLRNNLENGTSTTYTYSGNGLKRSEVTSGGTMTLVWDGGEYLQGRS